MEWLIENGATVVISILLLLVITLIIRRLIRQYHTGTSACGGKCGGCHIAGNCCSSEQSSHK
ncbi:MAG TPA: FeoB-associated Cys-rich membrane protein [Firmicutes bacterium]|nr:FeoB-associated Cys-rich membrane protein [Bacillales bacterium]HJA40678.1 FeoB-associated Cys-rich membrane protein [Bacillota bacterium]